MCPASTRTLCFSPPRRQSCLFSTWLCLRSTTAPGRRLTPCPTATWLTPQRRPRPSTSSQIFCLRRSWLEITSSLWSKCKRRTLTFKKMHFICQQLLSTIHILPFTDSKVTQCFLHCVQLHGS